MNPGRRSRDLAQARRLELGLIGLRWFVVGFGVLQMVVTLRVRPDAPDYVAPVGFVLVGVLAIGNVAVSTLTERAQRADQLRRVGLSAFVLDVAVITGLVWTGSKSPSDPTWVLAYILPLEGAIRYQLIGALAPVVVGLASETLRELYLTDRFAGHRFTATAVALRVGMELVVAVVAGLMARSLRREADKARERAWMAEEAAHLAEAAARRETAARKELAAFHTAILAGVAAPDLDSGLQSMAESIARDLDLDSFAILLVEDDTLVAKGVHGSPGYQPGARLPLGKGVVGKVAAGGRALLIPGAAAGNGSPGAPAEAAVPLKVGVELLGVLHQRKETGSIPPEGLELLGGLADQIAMVVQAALLRARQEETLRRLRELDEMKSDFVAITSHELRTPLAAVRGFVNTLRRRLDELPTDEIHEFLGIVDQQTERLIRLVEDLLVVSRIEAGKITFSPEPIEPGSFLRELVRGLGDARKRVKLVLDPDLPDLFMVDPHRLDQILTNLLQNALKFSPPKSKVTLSGNADGRCVVFSVADQGVGIPADELARIFERFHQSDAASTRQAEGAGLGLYITKRLVEAMGGEIRVESEVEKGSVFTLSLPVAPTTGAPVPLSGAAQAD
ncbi:MAG: GAF domain-containing sensor histidine kinase [Actinobacteria bacterium]|nr:GAF domain-containing sensor histidine kinase [Actinomycetota bacterium]